MDEMKIGGGFYRARLSTILTSAIKSSLDIDIPLEVQDLEITHEDGNDTVINLQVKGNISEEETSRLFVKLLKGIFK